VAAPTITSVTPAGGLSLGETFVTIIGTGFNDIASGGTVNVLFGGVSALEAGVVDATKIIALTPGGVLGAADVTVENVPASGPPEPTTLLAAFTYRRPRIATERDKATSEDCAVLVITRTLVAELRRTVLENTHHNMHPEYVDVASAAAEQEVQSGEPSLQVLGPTVVEDPFYRINGRFAIETLAGSPGGAEFDNYHQPVTVRLDYSYVGVAKTKGEAMNLWEALTRYLDRTSFLEIPMDGSDKANGVISIEINPVWEQRANFSVNTTRSGFAQFTGALVLRGVQTIAAKVSESRGADQTIITQEPIP